MKLPFAFLLTTCLSLQAQDPSRLLMDDRPATSWENDSYPIGNGSIGATLFGGINEARLQFTTDSLWTGNENPSGNYKAVPEKSGEDHFGAFQNMGELVFISRSETEATKPEVSGYTRRLDLAKSIHTTSFTQDGVTVTREAIASYPDHIVAWRFTADKPGCITGKFAFRGAHPGGESISVSSNALTLNGTLVNGLKYAAQAKVIAQGGKTETEADHIAVTGCDSVLILLAADTNYVMDLSKKWMEGEAMSRVEAQLKDAESKPWETLLALHQKDYSALFDRSSIDLGTTPEALAQKPTRERIANYRQNAKELPRPCLDPDLEEMLYNYGRYLLISCSRPGTLPANLQGNWNNSNKPAWLSDYHTNINLQMNYWLAETTNLSELATPLFDLLDSGKPVYAKHTRLEYGKDVPGFVTRMSINPFGGGGWNWNIEGTAWLSQHYWTHYLFTGDEKFLKARAYPFLRDVSQFWLARLKPLPDGRLVVPNAWSHEHGPHEDGTAHAQQLMWDLFSNTIAAAEKLDTDPAFVKILTETRAKLVGPKIGSWGQLMEWMEEKPEFEKSNHRHTSHLFAVFPGKHISLATSPDLAQAAIVSLTQRGEVGDSRRSWTWAWRAALWARLGEPERAHSCIAGLLAYNTMDNLWTTHPPFQIDGNLGIPNGIAEMLLQAHDGQINLLPALSKTWPSGQVTGLKTPGGHTVSMIWKDGNLEKAVINKGFAAIPPILLQGKSIKISDPRITIE